MPSPGSIARTWVAGFGLAAWLGLGCGGGGGGSGGGATAASGQSAAATPTIDGKLEILTYNVAGLPEPLSSSKPATYTSQISPLLNSYEVVLVQEDFWYHRDLVAAVTHPHRSTPMAGPLQGGSRLVNDGLNHFSRYPVSPVDRHAWSTCNGLWDQGSDCLASKGFSMSWLTLRAGIEVALVNLHMDAAGNTGDVFAREQQVDQLRDHLLATTAGRALIVAGDFNLDGYDPVDEPLLQALMGALSLFDTCRALSCSDDRIDRVLYRSGDDVELIPIGWRVADEFVDPSGNALSDHKAVHATIGWAALVP